MSKRRPRQARSGSQTQSAENWRPPRCWPRSARLGQTCQPHRLTRRLGSQDSAVVQGLGDGRPRALPPEPRPPPPAPGPRPEPPANRRMHGRDISLRAPPENGPDQENGLQDAGRLTNSRQEARLTRLVTNPRRLLSRLFGNDSKRGPGVPGPPESALSRCAMQMTPIAAPYLDRRVLARILTRNATIYTARRGGADSGAPKAPWPLWGVRSKATTQHGEGAAAKKGVKQSQLACSRPLVDHPLRPLFYKNPSLLGDSTIGV